VAKKEISEIKIVVAIIASVFGLILLVVAHDPAFAAVLFLVSAILSLYSLLDWLADRD
jgi:hypothetical protein